MFEIPREEIKNKLDIINEYHKNNLCEEHLNWGLQFCKLVECLDGFSISVQAGKIHYCSSKENGAWPYLEFELGYPNREDELILEWAEDINQPTDTVYGIGCDLHNKKAIEKLVKILGIKPNKLSLSFICHDMAQVSHYTKPISTHVFKILKRGFPGPYTFLIHASNEVPKILKISKK